jgi:hypothetical protein
MRNCWFFFHCSCQVAQKFRWKESKMFILKFSLIFVFYFILWTAYSFCDSHLIQRLNEGNQFERAYLCYWLGCQRWDPIPSILIPVLHIFLKSYVLAMLLCVFL